MLSYVRKKKSGPALPPPPAPALPPAPAAAPALTLVAFVAAHGTLITAQFVYSYGVGPPPATVPRTCHVSPGHRRVSV